MAPIIRGVQAFPVSATLPRPVGDGQGLQPRRQQMFVRIETDDGVSGWGEGGAPVPGAALVDRHLGPALVGLDVRDTDLIHARLAQMRAARGVLGALDIAVWDARGRRSISRSHGCSAAPGARACPRTHRCTTTPNP